MRLTQSAAGAAAAVLAVGAISAVLVQGAATRREQAAARTRSTATLAVFEAVIGDARRSIGTLELLGARPPRPEDVERLLSDTGITGIAVLTRGSATTTTVVGALPSTATGADLIAGTRLAREAATDTGEPHIALPAPGVIAVVIPEYSADREVLTTDQRRLALERWTVATVYADALLRRIGVTPASSRLSVDGVVAAGLPGSAGDSVTAVSGEHQLANARWRLDVQPAVSRGLADTTWAVLAGAVLAVVAVAGVGRRDRIALDRVSHCRDLLVRGTTLRAELSPILQSSLDLGEVLPAIAVRLSDEFGLRAIAVELIGEDSSLVEVFAMGDRPRTAVGAATDELVFPLVRSGRTVGRLRVVPSAVLSGADVTAIRAVAELIAVTASNIELFEREQATVRRLTELDRLKDAFLGTISHELRTPITAIRGFAQLLCDRWGDFGDEDRREFLQRIHRNSTSLGLLVDDLLDFARLERQSIVVTPTTVRLDRAADSLVQQLIPLLREHRIVTDVAEPVEATADVAAIDRVLANLLTNAAKFSPAGSTIEVAVRLVDGAAELSVADEGPGISADERNRVFTRFYRGEGAVARATRGAGIGLAVVRELVVQMGGQIRIEDNQPRGTRMVVRLPVPGARLLPIPRQLDPADHPLAVRRKA